MKGQAQGHKVVRAQAVIAVCVALVCWLVAGPLAATAALVGGLINVVASSYFVWRLYGRAAKDSPALWIRSFYVAEALKLVLTAILFLVAIAMVKLPALPLLLGFAATLAAFWLALWPAGPPANRGQA